MKLNWGTGIAIFYILFVVSLVFQVFRSRQFDHSLVSDNYYELDLKYQERYNKLRNAHDSKNTIQFDHDKVAKKLSLQFPELEQLPAGKIHFFRPSNSRMDFEIEIQASPRGKMQLPTDQLAPGLWRVKVDWEYKDQAYYQEAVVII